MLVSQLGLRWSVGDVSPHGLRARRLPWNHADGRNAPEHIAAYRHHWRGEVERRDAAPVNPHPPHGSAARAWTA